MDAACKCLERQAKAQAQADQAEHKRKVAAREERAGRAKGRHINPATPKESKQVNLTDSDSGMMRRNQRREYQQKEK